MTNKTTIHEIGQALFSPRIIRILMGIPMLWGTYFLAKWVVSDPAPPAHFSGLFYLMIAGTVLGLIAAIALVFLELKAKRNP